MTHTQAIAKTNPARPCTAHDCRIGGGCFNCGWQGDYPLPKVRKTWKNSLSPEKNQARLAQMRFMKQVRKLLGDDYTVEFHFNPGGPAVWGETYVHVYKLDEFHARVAVVEACLSVEFSYIRQWDGRGSGRNIQIAYARMEASTFAAQVRSLATRPFVRF